MIGQVCNKIMRCSSHFLMSNMNTVACSSHACEKADLDNIKNSFFLFSKFLLYEMFSPNSRKSAFFYQLPMRTAEHFPILSSS